MNRIIATLLLLSPLLAGCALPPPSHSALYPPDEEQLKYSYIITHDRYHPWEFQPLEPYDGGR